jgi:LysM repeat protein
LHQIQEGETLSSLARRYLGTADRYPELFAANRDVLQSPDRLPVGVSLKVPTASSDVEAASDLLPAAPVVPIPRGAWRRGER